MAGRKAGAAIVPFAVSGNIFVRRCGLGVRRPLHALMPRFFRHRRRGSTRPSAKAHLCNGPGRSLLAYGQFTSRGLSAEQADWGIVAYRKFTIPPSALRAATSLYTRVALGCGNGRMWASAPTVRVGVRIYGTARRPFPTIGDVGAAICRPEKSTVWQAGFVNNLSTGSGLRAQWKGYFS